MQQTYLNAIWAKPPRVMGRQLLPLSCAHVYVLMSMESPFFTDGDVGVGDMALAVWVCQQRAFPFDTINTAFRSGRLDKRMRRWGARYNLLGLARDRETFGEYLLVNLQAPERFFSDKAPPRPARVEWPMAVVVANIRTGIPEDRAWNMPMPLASLYKLTAGYLDGDDSLKSADEERISEIAERKEAEAAEKAERAKPTEPAPAAEGATDGS